MIHSVQYENLTIEVHVTSEGKKSYINQQNFDKILSESNFYFQGNIRRKNNKSGTLLNLACFLSFQVSPYHSIENEFSTSDVKQKLVSIFVETRRYIP